MRYLVKETRQVISAGEAASIYGFGSPIHLACRELFPENNDGVGTIPVTIYPLEDDGSGAAAEGTITASGTATSAGAFRIKVNGMKSQPFKPVTPLRKFTVQWLVQLVRSLKCP